MNKVMLVGRLTRDPDIRYTQNNNCCARFSVAVDRRFKSSDHPEADFPSVVAWGKTAEFIEKYFSKGMRIGIEGRIQTGSYEKDGQKIYTTDVIAESVEFVESKRDGNSGSGGNRQQSGLDQNGTPSADGFMNIPEGYEDELPFN